MNAPATPTDGWPVPKSAYIHVPFCRHRCGYCNFSVVAQRDDLIERYVQAIDLELQTLDRPAIETLFIGGGTPTHLPPPVLDRFLNQVGQRFDLNQLVEFSVEANPEDIDPTTLNVLSDHGVNRISLGVQSFHQSKLNILQRGHDEAIAVNAIEMSAERIGNVSIDLIFAAPGETIEQWTEDLRLALSLPIDHLSTYALTFEKGTSFWNRLRQGELKELGDDVEVEMYQTARAMSQTVGLSHYEISNFARPDRQCLHNRAYWDGRGWYAAGPGAANFCDGYRNVNHRSTTTYLKKVESGVSPISESERITVQQYARERFAFGVRMIEGVDVDQLSRESGIDLRELCGADLAKMVSDGLISDVAERVTLTERGILFADGVASTLLG
ncbi:Oxygen-independent coproporphyrinogen-III oxidase-like protein [Rubripirellula obstinata]|uniref:Heme chaperone HemW n=1 Tax=Rubripirellula obstinata TaxID=406547 RepID=A0A5B1C9M0_9BACT|nr:Oxygen-independent coproporphyrinogen-III oxidase-like protein [Rubripirellula obstinata]